MSKNRKINYGAIFLLTAFFFGWNIADAATLKINSSVSNLYVGDTAIMNVAVDSSGFAINNAEAVIKFPTDLIDVISVNKSDSVFSLWVEDPVISSSAGTVSFNGGLPTPGFSGSSGSVISFLVKAKKAGQAQISFSSAAVRANDGLGTDVLTSKQGKTLTISVKEQSKETVPAPVLPKEQPKEIPLAPTPSVSPVLAIKVSSPTHPEQDQWYKEVNPKFKWTVPSGVDAVQTAIDDNNSGVPRITYSPAISEKIVEDLEDGIWYFKVRGRKNDSWGSINTYIARIDTTVPQIEDVKFAYNDNTKNLNINASVQDITSGIDHYEIFINDVLVKSVPAKEFVDGDYNLSFISSGNNKVRFVAIDRAGNTSESLGSFTSTNISAPEIEDVPEVVYVDDQILIKGKTQRSDLEITVKVKREGGKIENFVTKSNSDKKFFILLPKLISGNYDIWVEAVLGGNVVSSEHLKTKVTSELLVTIGSVTFSVYYMIIPLLIIIILSAIPAYYLGRHFGKNRHKRKMKVAIKKKDDIKTLMLLKKRLEKHLEILHHIRQERILTSEEKEMKEAIEGDLDEVDKALKEQE